MKNLKSEIEFTKTLLYFCIFSVSLMGLHAQTYDDLKFEVLDNTQGLISDVVQSSHKGPKGYMWFGTAEGIVMYDGYEFKNMKDHPHLGQLFGMNIECINSDSHGNILIGTDNGFFSFGKNYNPTLNFIRKKIKDKRIMDIYVSKDGTYYIATGSGLFICNLNNKSVTKATHKRNNKIYKQIKQLTEDKHGNIWTGAWDCQLLRLNEDKKTFTEYDIWDKKTSSCINTLAIDQDNELWVGTWKSGIYQLDIEDVNNVKIKRNIRPNNSKFPGNVVLDLCIDNRNNIWAGTTFGICIIDRKDKGQIDLSVYKESDIKNQMSHSTVTHIYNGDDDIIWLSTSGGGINKVHLSRNQFNHSLIPKRKAQTSQQIYGFGLDNKDRLLIGVKNFGFGIKENDKITLFSEHKDYKHLIKKHDINSVISFLDFNKEEIWLGTRYNGIIISEYATQKTHNIKKEWKKSNFKGREIRVMKKIDKNTVIVGTELGINIVERKNSGNYRQEFIPIDKQKHSCSIQSISEYKKDQYIITTSDRGLFLLSKQSKSYNVTKLIDALESEILCSQIWNNNELWIGTKGKGLYRYNINNKNLTNIQLAKYNVGDLIYGIESDNKNQLWITTNKGLTKLSLKNNKYLAESFSSKDGLQGNIFVQNSIFKQNDSCLHIGGYKGFNTFDPNKIECTERKAKVTISAIHIDNEALSNPENRKKITLKHNSNLSIQFSSLAYVFPRANKYAYKLEGISKEWKYVSSEMRTISFNNMSPGQFTFLLKSTNSKGIWSDNIVALDIHIKEAPFRSIWAKLFYIIIITCIIWLFLRQRLTNERIKQEGELEHMERLRVEKLNKYKLSFFTNISHELLTPLSILSTSMDNIKRSKTFNKDNLDVMERNVSNLNRLIKQLLTFRKVETGNMKAQYHEHNISDLIKECVEDFNIISEKKNMSLDIEIEEAITGQTDSEKVELIVRNLLSNALKYNTEGGNILFMLTKGVNNTIQIKVKDDGCGIAKDKIEKLFSRFYRINDNEKAPTEGMGIGLNLTKSLIDIMGGKIEVSSELHIGTTFTVTLPITGDLTSEKMESDLFSGDVKSEKDLAIKKTNKCPQKNQDFNILLVEDNDDFRTVLKNYLEPYYKIHEAINGIEGLRIAKERNIDLILSDVMMPQMTGTELCKEIKRDKDTSHIAVVLLTAKVGDENRKEGYEVGADSYLEKPVNIEMLSIRIDSMLKQREILRQQITTQSTPRLKKINITPYDEKFFNEVKELVEKNIENVNFSVKDIASKLKVSNSMLYRKMKSLAGLSPSDYIRDIRLKQAGIMLENKNYSISEVAYSCGFNELSYFGLCFKKVYGVTPTQYQEGKRAVK